jgi:hypothetical protein
MGMAQGEKRITIPSRTIASGGHIVVLRGESRPRQRYPPAHYTIARRPRRAAHKPAAPSRLKEPGAGTPTHSMASIVSSREVVGVPADVELPVLKRHRARDRFAVAGRQELAKVDPRCRGAEPDRSRGDAPGGDSPSNAHLRQAVGGEEFGVARAGAQVEHARRGPVPQRRVRGLQRRIAVELPDLFIAVHAV